MRLKLTRSIDAGGHREYTLDLERAPDPEIQAERERYAIALEAIQAAPSAAEEIALAALGE